MFSFYSWNRHTKIWLFYCIFSDELNITDFEETANPNLKNLRNVLYEYCKDPDSRCIIFVQTRVVAEGLVAWLDSEEEDLNMKAAMFTGSSAGQDDKGNYWTANDQS